VKERERWFSGRLQEEITLVRWGSSGRPVLVFPSAGGDAEEIERYGLVEACGELLAAGRVKLYSVDSVAGQVMVTKAGSPEHRTWVLNQFHECIRHEVVPAIHADLGGQALDLIATGSSIGAFNAIAKLERLRQRFALLASGDGDWEDIGESWRLASVLGGKGIPNRVDNWGPEWSHDWPTWRRMLPQYLGELA
jgi:esterase/lipase superfamily enzyme